MSGTAIATAAIPSNLGQPHRYGFQSSIHVKVCNSPVKRQYKWHRLSRSELGLMWRNFACSVSKLWGILICCLWQRCVSSLFQLVPRSLHSTVPNGRNSRTTERYQNITLFVGHGAHPSNACFCSSSLETSRRRRWSPVGRVESDVPVIRDAVTANDADTAAAAAAWRPSRFSRSIAAVLFF